MHRTRVWVEEKDVFTAFRDMCKFLFFFFNYKCWMGLEMTEK